MLKFLSSVLCTCEVHPFLLGHYLGTSLTIGNLMRIRVTNAEWTWLGLEWPLAWYVAKRHTSLLSRFLLKNSLYFGIDEIESFQKFSKDLDKMTIANLGKQHQRSSNPYFKNS